MVDARKESVNLNLNSRYRLRCSDPFHIVRDTENGVRLALLDKRMTISQ